MARITSKQKQELHDALDRITDLCAEGTDPNTAIVKVASDMRLTPDTLPILVRGYNVGATSAHWKSSGNATEKVASFPIANLDKIHSMLYPGAVKKASVRTVVKDNTFDLCADLVLGNCFPSVSMEKYAELSEPEGPVVYRQEDVDMAIRKTQAVQDHAVRIIDQCALQKFASDEEFDACVESLANVMTDPESQDIRSMQKFAEAVYGDSGKKLLEYTFERFPVVQEGRRNIKNASAIAKDSPFCQCLSDAIKALDQKINAEYTVLDAKNRCAAAIKSAERKLSTEEVLDQILTTPADIQHDIMEKEAYDFSGMSSLSDYVARPSGPAWGLANQDERTALMYMKDRSPFRNQKVRTLLMDLMNTDPYLREQDPDVVSAAFNDLYEANPIDATKRIWLKTQLPQYIASDRMDVPTLSNTLESGRNAQKMEMDSRKSIMDDFTSAQNLELSKAQVDLARDKQRLDERKYDDELRNNARADRARADRDAAAYQAEQQARKQQKRQEKRKAREQRAQQKQQTRQTRLEAKDTAKRARIAELTNIIQNKSHPAHANGYLVQQLYSDSQKQWDKRYNDGMVNLESPYKRLQEANLPPSHPIWSIKNLSPSTNPMILQELMDLYGIKTR